jgi:lysophospholipase L1-like esterase
MRAWIKNLLGREMNWDNIKRNQFNELAAREFGNGPLLDLARIESTRLDGSRQSFTRGGTGHYAMVPEYTSDGGHLSPLGRKLVARQLLLLLANLAERR